MLKAKIQIPWKHVYCPSFVSALSWRWVKWEKQKSVRREERLTHFCFFPFLFCFVYMFIISQKEMCFCFIPPQALYLHVLSFLREWNYLQGLATHILLLIIGRTSPNVCVCACVHLCVVLNPKLFTNIVTDTINRVPIPFSSVPLY